MNLKKTSGIFNLLYPIAFISIFSFITFNFGVNKAHAVYPLGTELILYHFEEEATGTTTDAISATTTNSGTGGSTYDGKLNFNSMTTTTVKLFGSRSAYFNELGDYLNTYFGSSTNPTTQSISVSLWAYKGNNNCSAGEEHVFGTGVSGQNTRFYIRCKNSTTNKWDYRIQGNADFYSTNPVATTSWDHIVLVANATSDTATFYINGTAIGSPAAYTTYAIPGNFYVGNLNDVGAANLNQGAGAYIDEVAIYNTALTASDVTTLYQAGLTGGAVSSLTATSLDNRAYLSWTAGSGTTTDYLVEYKLSTEPTTWTTFSDGVSTTTNTIVTGLTNNLAYNFRITPKNGEVLGIVSSTATATPKYTIEFVNPTPVNGSTSILNTITAYASTTPLTPASTTDTIRLENSIGGLISQISTTTRYGDFNLTHLYNTVSARDLALLDNTSGVAYVPTTDTLFVIHNRATGADSTIDEINKEGVVIRTITCTSCGDNEGITLVSSVASSTIGGYDHTFMISTENNTANAEIFRVVIHSTGAVTVNKNDYYNTGITHAANGGLEGIAYDSVRNVYYVARELTTPALYKVTLGSGHSATSEALCGNLSWNAGITDFSDLTYKNDILYALSENTNPSKLVAVNVSSSTNCTYVDSDGDGDSTSSDTGDWLTIGTAAGATDQAEGVTWDYTGDTLYVIGEADYLAKYRSNAYTTRQTFSGLANGDYILKASSLDSNGLTTNASSTSFTINVDTTPPTASITAPNEGSTVSGASVTISANASDDTAVAGVLFKIDTNTAIGVEDTTSTYSVNWDSTGIADGAHTLIAVARDTAGNLATSTVINITVDNTAPIRSAGGPTGTLASGSTGAIILLTTNEIANCSYATSSGVVYGSMTPFSVTNGTSHTNSVTGLTNGSSYNYYVKCQDSQGNTNASDYNISFSVATDVNSPLLSSISSGSPASTTATITWTTDENSSSKVLYGLTSVLGTSTAEINTSPRVTSHSVSLSNLVPCALYYYSVQSTDSDANTATSTVYNFLTDGCTGSAAVVDDAVSSITNGAGGSLNLVTDNKGPTLIIPPGFSAGNADFQIKKLSSVSVVDSTGLPTGLSLASDQIYDFKAYSDVSTPVTSFDEPIEVTIAYSNADVSGLDESSLTIKRWNGSSWNDLTSCSVNTSANTVTCSTLNFSVFGLFGLVFTPPPAPDPAPSPVARIIPQKTQTTANARVKNLLAMGQLSQAKEVAGKYNINIPNTSVTSPLVSTTTPKVLLRLTKPLFIGSIDNEVKIVQRVLNSDPETIVAISGAGSKGKETKTFLGLTKKAVGKFQIKHGLVKSEKDISYGRVGPATRKKMNEILESLGQ